MNFDLITLSPIIAFVAVVALIPLVSMLARAIGLVDKPGGRKHHEGDIPLIGGFVIFFVFACVAGFTLLDPSQNWPLFGGIFLLLLIGGLDDLLHIHPWIKFFAQIAAACLVVLPGHALIENLGDLFGLGDFYLGWMAIPFSLAAVTLLINAMNLMDGLDGLTAGKSTVIIGWLLVAAFLGGDMGAVQVMAILLGALVAFLIFNMRSPFRKKASVFLGDAGSMSLGLTIGWFAIGLAKEADGVIEPISVAWILALPIMDTCAQFYRRMRMGRHPFSPDRGHFHHHFIDSGFSVGAATFSILCLGVLFGGIGYFGLRFGVPQVVLTSAWIALLFVHMAISANPVRYVRIMSAVRVDKRSA
jgi:UDP-GlcNAc:undecaprenyl-phosphate/decaprenyl-phosphate GlcNAc-1-phosphate transferase